MVIHKGTFEHPEKRRYPNGLSVSKLFELLPDDLVMEVAKDMQADKRVRKLPAVVFVKLLIYSILEGTRLSLRTIEENYNDQKFVMHNPTLLADEVTRAGIRERLIHLDAVLCERLYEHVYREAEAIYGEQELGKYHIKRFDSTMIASFAHLLEGMRVGNTSKNKTQVKITTEFKDDFLIRFEFHQDQKHLSEETALRESILNSPKSERDIVVVDKGLKSRKTFELLDKEGIKYVGRLGTNVRYELANPETFGKNRPECPDTYELEYIMDEEVYLFEDGTKRTDTTFRMVQYRVRESGMDLYFVTNLRELHPSSIASMYRRRWDIEVLFRFMKQEMHLTHFVSNDPNAILVMLYLTMITAMMVLIYKNANGIKVYKLAKIKFHKELFFCMLAEIMETPEGLEWIRKQARILASSSA